MTRRPVVEVRFLGVNLMDVTLRSLQGSVVVVVGDTEVEVDVEVVAADEVVLEVDVDVEVVAVDEVVLEVEVVVVVEVVDVEVDVEVVDVVLVDEVVDEVELDDVVADDVEVDEVEVEVVEVDDVVVDVDVVEVVVEVVEDVVEVVNVEVEVVVVVVGTTGPSPPLTLPTLMASATNVPPRVALMRFICEFIVGAQIWATTVVLGLVDDPVMFTPRPLTSTRRSVGVPSALIRASGCTLNLSETCSVLGAATVTILPLFESSC